MSRAGLAVAVAVVAAAALVLALGGGGDEDEPRQPGGTGFGRLAWDSEPVVFVPRTLPRDRILTGRLRNDSLREVELVAADDIELRDRAGRPVQHTATFAQGFGRDIYPPRFQRELSEADELRLGRRARIRPGATKSLTLAWRARGRRAVRIELPGGALRVPATSRRWR